LDSLLFPSFHSPSLAPVPGRGDVALVDDEVAVLQEVPEAEVQTVELPRAPWGRGGGRHPEDGWTWDTCNRVWKNQIKNPKSLKTLFASIVDRRSSMPRLFEQKHDAINTPFARREIRSPERKIFDLKA